MTDCNPTILKAELKSLFAINERLNCELESLRQENARLRERMNQLTDDYEGTIKRLREALKYIIAWGPDPHIAKVAREALNQTKE